MLWSITRMPRYKIIIVDDLNKQSYELGPFEDMDLSQFKGFEMTPDGLKDVHKHKCLLKLWSGSENFDDIEGELT
jgi:hypothetical protein